MAGLTIRPMMWKHNLPVERTDENVVRFDVDGNPPPGMTAYILLSAGEQWCYGTALPGSEPVDSEARFNLASEAAAALEAWVGDNVKRRECLRDILGS